MKTLTVTVLQIKMNPMLTAIKSLTKMATVNLILLKVQMPTVIQQNLKTVMVTAFLTIKIPISTTTANQTTKTPIWMAMVLTMLMKKKPV